MEARFEIEITGKSHYTWQGLLHTAAGPAPFSSELELMQALDRLLGGTAEGPARCGGSQEGQERQ